MPIDTALINYCKKMLIFLYFVVSSEISGMTSILLTDALNKEAPLNIVTLTRVTRDKEGNMLLDRYPPISASEAVTIFSIASFLLGDKNDLSQYIRQAYKFDEEQFTQINKEITSKNHEDNVKAELLNQLITAGIDDENLRMQIVNAIINGQSIDMTMHVKIDKHNEDDFILKTNVLIFRINNIVKGSITKKNFLDLLDKKQTNIPEWFGSLPDTENLKGCVDCYVFNKKLANVNQKDKIKQLALSYKSIDEKLKKNYFQTNPFLFGYLSIPHIKNVSYYLNLLQDATNILSIEKLISTPCIFVTNELFFGKDFILPHTYPKLIPDFPSNVLSCINFLLYEESKVSGTVFATEVADWDEDTLPRWIDTADGNWSQTIDRRYFRSVSFYKIYDKVVQEYSKSSYYQECDSALRSGYTYLFGQRSDLPIEGDFINLVSTQICFDLQSKVRAEQNTISALIHIFQSNTHELEEVLLKRRSTLEPSREDIPGNPKIIIHADPKNQEVFAVYNEERFIFCTSNDPYAWTSQEGVLHYTHVAPKKAFTFSVDKGDYMNSYTITIWAIPSESK